MQLVAVPDSMEELLTKCGQKLGLSAAGTVYTENGAVVDDVSLISNDDVLYIAEGSEPFFRDAKGKKAKKGSPVAVHKVAVLGSGGVGKSCLTMRFCRSTFVDVYDPTIEDSFHRHLTLDGFPVLLDILDTAGQEDFVVLRRQWVEDRDGFILVYSITDETTFGPSLDGFVDLIKEVKGETFDKVPLVLVGNKCDLEPQREISTEDGQAYADGLNSQARFLEASALSNHNVATVFHEIVRIFRHWDPPKATKKGFCVLL